MQGSFQTAFAIVACFALPSPAFAVSGQHLAPKSHKIVVTVVDENGQPVGGASLDHSGDQTEHITNANGRIALESRAPILVIRRSGFHSEIVRADRDGSIRIVLNKIGTVPTLPKCRKGIQTLGINGWEAEFRLPADSAILASTQTRDADYGLRTYALKERHSSGPVIIHGSGPTWSLGEPLDKEVWNSATFTEVDFDVDGLRVIDARGKLENGKFWRSLTRLGESISYSDVDQGTAREFDSLLDGVCIRAAGQE